MTLSFWLSLAVALLCLVVVVVCLVVRHAARKVEREARFWAEIHDAPPNVTRRPR